LYNGEAIALGSGGSNGGTKVEKRTTTEWVLLPDYPYAYSYFYDYSFVNIVNELYVFGKYNYTFFCLACDKCLDLINSIDLTG